MNDMLQAPAIEPLPSAPLLERFLFEQPLIPVVVLAILAIVAAIAFASRGQRRRGLLIAVVLAAVAAGVYTAASVVTTERERMLERTAALIAATATVDTASLNRLLTEDASLRASGDIERALGSIEGLAEIMDQAEYRLQGRYRITDWEIHDRQATLDGPNVGRTLVRVGVDVESFGRTHYSWWRLHWERTPDGQWRCFEIEPRWIQFVGSAR